MNNVFLLFLLVICIGCETDRSIEELNQDEMNRLEAFQAIVPESKVRISDINEPGERLNVCLTFKDAESTDILSHRIIGFYHASHAGEYEPDVLDDETTARLSGQATTNALGQIYIETILPGDYGSSGDNRHIHTTVFGAHPESYDIHFKQHAGYMLRSFVDGSDQHFLADLKKTADNELVCFVTIAVKNPNSNQEP